MISKYRDLLLHNKIKVGIWGSGYIGFTTAVNFAINGVEGICYDTNKDVVEAIRRGDVTIPNLEYWIGFPIKPFIRRGLLTTTHRVEDMLKNEVKVHMIAVPTEKGGEPWSAPLEDVIGKIGKKPSAGKPPELIIIESTLTPKDVEKVVLPILHKSGRKVGKDILVGVAPRRDWFHSSEKNIKNLPRVYAGTDARAARAIHDVLSIICDRLIEASSVRIAELVKAVENSLLHVPAVYAMQLALAYPDIDITEVLRLASTHWRIPYYYPTMGTGGYCIPVSSKYVKLGATRPEQLTIVDEVLKYDGEIARIVVDEIAKIKNPVVGLMGLCYKSDLKVHTLSPSMLISELLKTKGIGVKIHDPYYTEDEIRTLTGLDTFSYPDGLKKFNCIVIVPEHRIYTQTPVRILSQCLKRGQHIFDNTGTWEKYRGLFTKKGIVYRKIGDANWLAD